MSGASRVFYMNNAITTGQTIRFSSQCKAANGTWRAYNIQGEIPSLESITTHKRSAHVCAERTR